MVRGLSSERRKRSAIKVAQKIRSLVSSPGSSSSSSSHSWSSSSSRLVENCTNFRASGEPARFLYFHGGRWNDFSVQAFELLSRAFMAGSPMAEVGTVGGGVRLVDFLRMLEVDSVTGRQRSISWIDVHGRCFFPKVMINDDLDGDNRFVCELPIGNSSLPNLEIEIRIKRCGDEIKTKLVRVGHEDPIEEHCGENVGAVGIVKVCSDYPVAMKIEEEDGKVGWQNVVRLKENEKAYNTIQSMFLASFKSSVANPTIVNMYKCLHCGSFGRGRLQAFVKKVELTKASGKAPNVRFAWYCSSYSEVSSIFAHGFEQQILNSKSAPYGFGVRLSPLNSLQPSSLSLMEADEKGEKHVILCRVMLGEMERIESGSEQFKPSSEEYDSGVDDLQNPRFYVVWRENMNQTILPEFVVSFKSLDHQPESKKASALGPNLSFPKLFEEIGKFLPSSRMQVLESFYKQYRMEGTVLVVALSDSTKTRSPSINSSQDFIRSKLFKMLSSISDDNSMLTGMTPHFKFKHFLVLTF